MVATPSRKEAGASHAAELHVASSCQEPRGVQPRISVRTFLRSARAWPYTPVDVSGGAPTPVPYPTAPSDGVVAQESSPRPASPPRLLDRLREAVRARHFSRRTEKAYVHWSKRYIFFHCKRHPAEMGAREVTEFLTALAVRHKVAASTQNQALSALLFLYRHVLGVELPWLDDLVRAKRPRSGSPSS